MLQTHKEFSSIKDLRLHHKESLFLHIKKNIYIYLMISLVLSWYIVFCYLPMYGIILSFQDFRFDKGVLSPFLGFKNFTILFSQKSFMYFY